jgi:AraC-like DNA-binding protein
MKDLPPVETFCEKFKELIDMYVNKIPGGIVCSREDIKQEMYLQLVMTYRRMLKRDDVETLKAVECFIWNEMVWRVKNFLAQTLHPVSYKKAHNWFRADKNRLHVMFPSGNICHSSLLETRLNLKMDLRMLLDKHDENGMMRMYYKGLTVKQIAQQLGLSERQTYYRFGRLKDKFQEIFTHHDILPEVR